MSDLSTAAATVLRTMQERGEAALTSAKIERLAQIGSSDSFDAAVEELVLERLVLRHQFSRQLPEQLSLTAEGRSFRRLDDGNVRGSWQSR